MLLAKTAHHAQVESQTRSTRELIREKIATWLRAEAGLPADTIDDDSSLSKLGIDSFGLAYEGETLQIR